MAMTYKRFVTKFTWMYSLSFMHGLYLGWFCQFVWAIAGDKYFKVANLEEFHFFFEFFYPPYIFFSHFLIIKISLTIDMKLNNIFGLVPPVCLGLCWGNV